MLTLNEVFSRLSARRRYEVWFVRMGLADGSGALWLRYLLTNPGRCGCSDNPRGMPVQVWATWFPKGSAPQSLIQGFALANLEMSPRDHAPFHLRVAQNEIDEVSCCGSLQDGGHAISWNLRYQSTFRTTLSSKGWIGFSRTPHSDARFAGEFTFDGNRFAGDPLGFGVQGHNSGYRHRNFWKWTHVYFPRNGQTATTLEALIYEMPFGLLFRKAVLWHEGAPHIFANLCEAHAVSEKMLWHFHCENRDGVRLIAAIDGRGPSLHRLPYVKTDCTGSFEVANNSLASATLVIESAGASTEKLETTTGAVLESVG